MVRSSTFLLKSVIVLIGLFVLSLCVLALPAGILSDQTGYYRYVLLGLYIPAVPFFIALYVALQLLNLIDKNNAFSVLAVTALKRIKYCAITIAASFSIGMPYIFYAADKDDAPGVVLIALIIIFTSSVIAAFAAVLQKLLANALEIKAENELTV